MRVFWPVLALLAACDAPRDVTEPEFSLVQGEVYRGGSYVMTCWDSTASTRWLYDCERPFGPTVTVEYDDE